MKRILFVIIFSGLMTSFFILHHNVQAEDAVKRNMTIIFTHDLHDNYYPFSVLRDGEFEKVGGFARIAEIIREEKEKNPDALVVDAGDYSMGTLFQTIYATESPSLRLFGQMDYDVVTFGNHEFDFRALGLAHSLEAAIASGDDLPPIVASNIIYPTDDDGVVRADLAPLQEAMDAYGVMEYTVIEKNGVKMGIIGLLGEEAAGDAPMSGVSFDDIVSSSKKVVEILQEKENVDMIVAVSHSGTNENPSNSEDELLAKEVPEIDVIISGHSHTLHEEAVMVGDTIIGSSGAYGQYVGVMDVEQTGDGPWQLKRYETIRVTEDVPENPEMVSKIDMFKGLVQSEYLDLFDLEFDEVIAHTPFDFTEFNGMSTYHAETTIGNLIGDAFIHTVKESEGDDYVDIAAAIVPVGNVRSSFYTGDLTVSDVFNVISLGVGADELSGYPLVSAYLTGKELKTVAEVDASVTPIFSDVQLYISGLSYTFNPNRMIFNKVTDVKRMDMDGTKEELVDDQLYRIVVGLYSAQMLPLVTDLSYGLLKIEPKTADGMLIEDFEKEIIHLQDGSNREIKEWYALANYVASFSEENGVSVIPDYYADTHGRKNVEASWNVIELLKKPNGIALTIYGIGIVLILIVGLIIRWIVRKVRRKVS